MKLTDKSGYDQKKIFVQSHYYVVLL